MSEVARRGGRLLKSQLHRSELVQSGDWLVDGLPIVVVVTGELCYALHEHVNLVLRA